MSLETSEVAVKLAGTGAKQLAILLYAILREQKKTKGKTRMTNMLRSGKELKVFAIKDTDLQLFCREAKKYGVLYCVLKDRDASDGLTDIMVRAEDASRINRIFERFNLATVDKAEVKNEIEQKRETQQEGASETMSEREVDEILDAMLSPAQSQERHPENPTEGRIEKSRRSEPISKPKEPTAPGTSDSEEHSRPSVRQELNDIKAEQQRNASKQEKSPRQKPAQHKAPPRKRLKKVKGR